MRAIINATGYRQGIAPLIYYRPTPMLCIAGKPIIFHIVEFLIQQQVTHFELVLNYLPQKIEKELGDGKRWGVSITYHLAREAEYPFQVIRPLAQRLGKGSVILALGDCLPALHPIYFKSPPSTRPLLFMFPSQEWSGWGIFPVEMLGDTPRHLKGNDFLSQIKGRYQSIETQPFLSVHTPQELRNSNMEFLSKEHKLAIFPTTARHVEPGVWISRGVSLHPTAKIVPPVFIGEFCQINKDACIGPDAVIEDYSIVDKESEVTNSLICKWSYVGEGLNVQDSIVDRNLLLNLSLDSHVNIHEAFILGASYPSASFYWPLKALQRVLAVLFFVLLSPIYVLMSCMYGVRRELMLKLPAHNDPALWKTTPWEIFIPHLNRKASLFYRLFFRLPLLKNIIRGDMHFVGVMPRKPTEVEKLPPDWKKLYISSKAGIITLSELENEEEANADKCYACEVFYAAQKSIWYDLQLICRWLKQKCKTLSKSS